MDFNVTVRTLTGAIKTVEVLNMPSEEAARAEAVAMTFGQILSSELISEYSESDSPKKKKRKLPTIEEELKPGETQNVITGWNNNPLAVFSSMGDLDMML